MSFFAKNLLPAPARLWWQARQPRERMILGLAALLLGVLLLLSLVDGVQAERRRLQRRLPLAEASLQRLQGEADEYTRLRAQAPATRLSGAALIEALKTSAAARGLRLEFRGGEAGVQVSGNGDFDAALAWLAEIQRAHALRPTQLELSAGHLSATLVQAP